ncbi:Transposon Tf2-6 polyprotein [Acropora cervicornis]|uniref:Transposon Tf2-6 polyprotein n=1 Tax=Acropora cervicornis TaxID=6130 RepID=A0AAD9V056_ACRCE|nr:Transposon Tf2-6 polyprotein [Acropora cervicornis]
MAALRRAFPPAEWDVLTTTIDAQIADEDKQHPARWLRQLSQHYLGEEPIIQSTHNFLRMLRQEPGMSIQDSHTLVRENLATLTFTQVISKARDFEAGLKTESPITKHHLEEVAHKVSPAAERPKTPHYSNRHVKDRPPGPSGSSTCPWCGHTPHPASDTASEPPTLPPGELTFDNIKSAYPHLLEGLGEMDELFSITLNPGVKPIQAAPHRYATPKLPIIKEALDKLVNTEQLIRVNKPTPWISNMVVRERPASDSKPAKVRIGLDPSQTINKAIIRPVYPIPTLEENIHRFHRAKIFSTFDIKDAFQTIRLTDESSFLTTMHTPWGRYRLTRLPFGISSAPEEFQRRLHDILCGLEGVVNIADDIIVVGRGDSLTDAHIDHDNTVLELLKRLSRHNLKLNPDKIKFKTCTAPFMGHVLSPERLTPSLEITNAILNMPQPQDKAATRRFLGVITYLSKFSPNLSTVTRPLRDLTHVDKEFLWADQHTEAFTKAKELVSKAPCLCYFDVNAPVVLQVDASEYGLGAALLQPVKSPNRTTEVNWQPVAFSSSSLTATEQRYAQIEKETLAIVHALRKFDQLLFGKLEITVHSDHKPLETIFKRPLASAPRRLQSMMLTLQRYSFTVEYRKGSSLLIADTLSRAPLPETTHGHLHDELVYRVEFEDNNPELSGFQDATVQEIRTEASTDPEQKAIRTFVETGWPNDKASVPVLIHPYWSVRHELTIHDGLLFKQDRVVIPSSLRSNILRKLRTAHRGTEFTLRHARSCVFWPGINSQIEDICKNCTTCAQHARQHPREPLKPYPVPTLPWQLVSQDLFALNGSAYLITVDHYSDFYELDRLPSIQSSSVIQATKQHFSRHGVPHTLITDNGAQFTSEAFRAFAEKYKFKHITSSPYWSQSNGRAEAAVKSAKHILLTAEDADLALLSVCNTPPAGHTYSPAKRLFGRTLRTDLPQSSATLEPRTTHRDTVVLEHLHQKSRQKKAGKYPPGLICMPSHIQPHQLRLGSLERWWVLLDHDLTLYRLAPRCRRNRVQLQLAPSPGSFKPLQPPTNKPQSYTSDSGTPQLSLGSSPIADPAPVPTPTTPAPTASSPTNSESPLALETSSSMCPSPPCTTGRPPALSNPVPHSSPTATNTPTGQTVTRSGRVIRRPARYSD